jgi:dTMP kinase
MVCKIYFMLTVLEGLDGAGKSTQVKKLRAYLESLSGNLEYIHFPRYDAPVYGELISRFLRGDFGANNAVHPQLVALLFAEDRHGAAPQMKEVLEQGGNILLDRYVYSNIAYQCAKLDNAEEAASLREWIFNTEYGNFGLPEPDLNIFLDVPIAFVESKLKSQRGGADREYLEGGQDIHEADIEFQKRVREIYRQQCEIDPKFIRIDCSDDYGQMLPPDEIFAKVKAVVDQAVNRQ